MEPIICSPSPSGQQNTTALTVAARNKHVVQLPFIEGNTASIELSQLREHCTPEIKSYNAVISHAAFVEVVQNAVQYIFRHEKIAAPQIRVSHPVLEGATVPPLMIVGDEQATSTADYFQRMVFVIELPSVSDTIGAEKVCMFVGGVGRLDSSAFLSGAGQRVQLFAGFMVRDAQNTCVFTNGLIPNLWVKDRDEISQAIYGLLCEYDAVDQLCQMEKMLRYSLSEQQFAHFLGKAMLYQQLPQMQQSLYPEFLFTDFQVSSVAFGYLEDKRFRKEKDGSISLWKLYNLLMRANKSSHIDLFLSRAANASSFVGGLATALERRKKHWFLR